MLASLSDHSLAQQGMSVPVSGQSITSTPQANTSVISTPTESSYSNAQVSDLDSDMEPDQLIPAYLKLKEKIYDVEPDLSDNRQKNQKGRNSKAPPVQSPALKKLLSQLQQLESDALFDKDEAEAQWRVKRNILAQTKSQQRKANAESNKHDHPEIPAISVVDPDDEKSSTDEEADMLGGMFSSAPEQSIIGTHNQSLPATITLRDFGRQTGLSPKRLLEEAVHARYVCKTQSLLSIA
jgi:ATP-dependent RNA helicase DHX29